MPDAKETHSLDPQGHRRSDPGMTQTYTRPLPPEHMWEPGLGFSRAEDVEELIRRDFVGRDGLFFDAEHGHLTSARIGVLWASSRHVDKGSEKAGTAQLVKPYDWQPQKWGQAMQHMLMRQFYAEHEWPHFRITLSAPICGLYDDRQFFALTDHEVCHCAVAKDGFGCPRFSDVTGLPVWSMRPHESEQFSGTVERWGAAATGTLGIVLAGLKAPRFGWVPGTELDVRKACGVV